MTIQLRMLLTNRQTSFVALNIEPEDDSEDEIDDSKEIQVGCLFYPENGVLSLPAIDNPTDRRGVEAVPSGLEIAFSVPQFL